MRSYRAKGPFVRLPSGFASQLQTAMRGAKRRTKDDTTRPPHLMGIKRKRPAGDSLHELFDRGENNVAIAEAYCLIAHTARIAKTRSANGGEVTQNHQKKEGETA